MLLAFFAGVATRVWFYLLNDSFWRDETKLLLNIAQNSFLDLLNPLRYGQEGPITYLWFLRALWLLGVNGEMAMRGVSLLASLLSLYLFYLLISNVLLDYKSRFFSVLLFALSPGIILFAGLTKQYSIDLLVATSLLYSSRHWFISRDSDDFKMDLNNYVLVALAPWFSLPSIFIIIAIGVGLLMKNRRHLRTALIFTIVGCASFSSEWLLVLKRCLGIKEFIKTGFLQYTRIADWLWTFKQIFFSYTGPDLSFILIIGLCVAMILLLVGIMEVKRKFGLSLLVLLLLPLILSLGASIVKVYPIFGRCLLFATPGIYLLIGYGMEHFFRSNKRSSITGVIISAALIFPCLNTTLLSYGKPIGGVRDALQFIAARWQNNDVVLCNDFAAPSIVYYRCINRPYATVLKFALEPEKQIEGNTISRELPYVLCRSIYSHQRVWLVSETIFQAHGNSSSVSFLRYGAKILQHFGVKLQVNYPDYWRTILNNLSAKRRVVHQYITDRVQVYGLDKQNVSEDTL